MMIRDTDKKFEEQLDRLADSTRSPQAQFSAEATRLLLEKRIVARRRHRFLRAVSSVAAIVLLGVASWSIYLYIMAVDILTVSTLGETKSVRLPDGTEVVLNRHSTLSYPDRFRKNNREVSLRGGAYFAVTKNAEHPFVVQTEVVDVRVLGTEFSIEAYPGDEQVKTSLFEGSVAVNTKDNQRLILAPGECAVYHQPTLSLNKQQIARPDDEIAWKKGTIIFHHLPLGEIARRLSNVFDVKIHIPDSTLAVSKMSARFIHDESIDSILHLLQEAGGFEVVKDENTIQFILNH